MIYYQQRKSRKEFGMYDKIKELIMEGEEDDIEAAVQEAVDGGADPNDIIKAMTETMDVVGEQFTAGDLFVPEMLVSAETMQKGMNLLKPLLKGEEISTLGTVVMGTVEGDMHDIGKNLVAMMFESAGFEVIDLGVDVPPETYVETVKAHPECNIIGLSALLTTTMHAMAETVEALDAAGLHTGRFVMIGGAPSSAAFAAEIGADAYTPDAASAAAKAKELVA